MSKKIKISNAGEIEIAALTLLGATNKRDDETKIGYFGSGFKYSLAYAIRTGINIKIYSGENEIKIGTSESEFRGNKIRILTVNETPTSITDDFGANWNAWFLLREIISNAIDEGGETIELTDEDTGGETGRTNIIIEMNNELNDVYKDLPQYFAYNRTPIYSHKGFRIYPKHGEKSIIYRRGIRISEVNGLFDYDFDQIEINESRSPVHSWTVGEALWLQLARVTNKKILRLCLKKSANAEFIEGGTTGVVVSFLGSPTDTWREILEDKLIIGESEIGLLSKTAVLRGIVVSDKIKSSLLSHYPDLMFVEHIENNRAPFVVLKRILKTERAILETALKTFEKINYSIDYKIEIARFTDNKIMGTINGETIVLNRQTLTLGQREIMLTILEEQLHIKSGAYDETRLFQNAIFGEFLSYALNEHHITQ